MPFKSFEEIVPPMEFPIRGKVYSTYGPGVQDAEKLRAYLSGADGALAAEPPEVLWRLLLGPLYDEMVQDGLDDVAVTSVGVTVLANFRWGPDVAAAAWETSARPGELAEYLVTALAPARAAAENDESDAAAAEQSTALEAEEPQPQGAA